MTIMTDQDPFADPADEPDATPAAELGEFADDKAEERPPASVSADDDRVRELCSLLIANGYVHREECRDLLYNDELRARVEERLDSVGMKLLFNTYSEYWGVGLNEATAADDRLEWSNNFGLERGAMALLLIVWCKLILPKRLAQEERQPEDGSVASLFPEVERVPNPQLSVSRDQIIAEFGDLLGGVGMTSRYIAQLARARLIKAHGGVIEEGPLLPLVIDETQLTDELRREVLLGLLRREHATREAEPTDKGEGVAPEQPAETTGDGE